MKKNSLTYEFAHVPAHAVFTHPDALIMATSEGETRYVPEVLDVEADPGPVFKPGQIVKVVGTGFTMSGWYGVVTDASPGKTRVEFGQLLPGTTWSYFTFTNSGNLALIHEAP